MSALPRLAILFYVLGKKSFTEDLGITRKGAAGDVQ